VAHQYVEQIVSQDAHVWHGIVLALVSGYSFTRNLPNPEQKR
jgi:hypothetical protein